MLIGIDASRTVAAHRTGTENYSFYLIRALLDIGRSHRYRLYFNQAPPDGLFARDERVTWRILPFPRLWTHVRLAGEVIRHPPDVLFIPAHVLPWIHPRRCVATIHDLGYLHYPEAHTPAARRYLSWSTRFNARAARRVIVDSESTRSDLVARHGIDSARVVLAYPAGADGFAPVVDSRVLEAVQRRYNTGPRYFLHVGTLQPRKNLTTLIHAFSRLIDGGSLSADTKLVLAGKSGWLYEDILKAAQEPGLRGRVEMPGYVPDRDLPAIMSGALAFVLPSLYEGFGLPVLEAMACDTPVICSNVSSLPEVAGDAALLIAPMDVESLAQAMAQVYQDSDLRREMVARGRARLAKFSWQACADTVLRTLETVGAEGYNGP